jgi:hypothetical protein
LNSQRGGQRFDPAGAPPTISSTSTPKVLRRPGGSGFRLRARTPAIRLKFDPAGAPPTISNTSTPKVLRRPGGSGFRLRARTPAIRLKFDPAGAPPTISNTSTPKVLRRPGGSGFRLRAQTPAIRLKFDPAGAPPTIAWSSCSLNARSGFHATEQSASGSSPPGRFGISRAGSDARDLRFSCAPLYLRPIEVSDWRAPFLQRNRRRKRS